MKKINSPTKYTNISVIISYIIMEQTTLEEQIIIGNVLMNIGQLVLTNTAIDIVESINDNLTNRDEDKKEKEDSSKESS